MPTNHVFCDESHIDTHDYRIQGGIRVPEIGMRAVREAFKVLRARHPKTSEFKWAYVSGREPRHAYTQLVELFFNSDVAPLMTLPRMLRRSIAHSTDR